MPITDFQETLKGDLWHTLAPGERIFFEENELCHLRTSLRRR